MMDQLSVFLLEIGFGPLVSIMNDSCRKSVLFLIFISVSYPERIIICYIVL